MDVEKKNIEIAQAALNERKRKWKEVDEIRHAAKKQKILSSEALDQELAILAVHKTAIVMAASNTPHQNLTAEQIMEVITITVK